MLPSIFVLVRYHLACAWIGAAILTAATALRSAVALSSWGTFFKTALGLMEFEWSDTISLFH